MASKPNNTITGGVSAPSNLVRLPTAAARKVDNFRFKEQRAQLRERCATTADRFKYRNPVQREEDKALAWMKDLERTPELALILCILSALDHDQTLKVLRGAQLMRERNPDCPVALLALGVAAQAMTCAYAKGME